jgi:hypothetical protein
LPFIQGNKGTGEQGNEESQTENLVGKKRPRSGSDSEEWIGLVYCMLNVCATPHCPHIAELFACGSLVLEGRGASRASEQQSSRAAEQQSGTAAEQQKMSRKSNSSASLSSVGDAVLTSPPPRSPSSRGDRPLEKRASSAETTLFDAMFMISPEKVQEEHVNHSDSSDSASTHSTAPIQQDLVDALVLLRQALTAHSTNNTTSSTSSTNSTHSTHSTNSTITDITDLMQRLRVCEEKISSPIPHTHIPHIPHIPHTPHIPQISYSDLDYINNFIAQAEGLVGRVTDESTWGGRLPECLHMRGFVGGVDMEHTGAGSQFSLRGSTYLKDGQQVGGGCRLQIYSDITYFSTYLMQYVL